MLSNYLKTDNRIMKLVCGAGNEDSQTVEKLVRLYSKCGCNMFDVSPNIEVVKTAKKVLQGEKDKFICVSFGMKQDPHIFKAKIDKNRCIQCGFCENVCPNSAIKDFRITEKKCIGCRDCYDVCRTNAIIMQEHEIDIDSVLPKIVNIGVDCIEFHVSAENEQDMMTKWEKINNYFDGVLSICIDREYLGNKQVIARINKMLETRNPYTTIVQADGIPMSASDDRYKTTLQAVAMAEIVQNAKLPVYIILSGGTNSKTAELANLCGIEYKGIALGSYARKIVRQYTDREDFYDENIFFEALTKANGLIVKNLV